MTARAPSAVVYRAERVSIQIILAASGCSLWTQSRISSACRGRHWNAVNRSPGWYADPDPLVRLHWHLGERGLLARSGRIPAGVHWDQAANTRSGAVPEGLEGISPRL